MRRLERRTQDVFLITTSHSPRKQNMQCLRACFINSVVASARSLSPAAIAGLIWVITRACGFMKHALRGRR
jgi:hypothetical protein